MRPLLLLAAASLLLIACSDNEAEVQCRVGADCASGVCLSDGTCALPQPGPDADKDQSTSEDAAEEPADLPDANDAESSSTSCKPNLDGVIARDEIPLQAGLNAKFKIATDVDIDTHGVDQGGTLTWDYSIALPGDHLTILELQKIDSLWFAPKFPTATYAARLSESADLLGVFQITDDQLLLLGVVSPADGMTRTELKYEPAVVVLQFPIEQGKTWSTNSQVSGVAMGVASLYSEKYESQVDAKGNLITPLSTFPVQRVRTLLTRTVGVMTTTTRSFSFATECFGTVATISSASNESAEEFTKAAEIRRLSP